MPAVNWVIEPVFLCRRPLPPDKSLDELEAITNTTLVSLIRQLSCLAYISNTIFTELSSECEQIHKKTETLKNKMTKCSQLVNNLNHKTVIVPLGTLNDFMRVDYHFKSNQETTSNLFTPDKRPPCIKYAYEKASTAPLNQFKSLAEYKHLNGILCQPFFIENKRKSEFLEIEQQKPERHVRASKLPRNAIVERAKSPLVSGETHEMETDEADSEAFYRLPSPNEVAEALAQEYPSSFIPIDTCSFQRSSSIRRSLIHGDQEIPRRRVSKRAKRRNTIHETDRKKSNLISPLSSSASVRAKYRERRNSDPSIPRVDESVQTEGSEAAIYSTGRIVTLKDSKGRVVGGKLECRAEIHREDERSNEFFTGSVITVKSIGGSSNIVCCPSTSGLSERPGSSSLTTNNMTTSTDNSGTTIIENKSNSSKLMKNNDLRPPEVVTKDYLSTNGIKMRDGASSKGPGDDGRSSSGNWSASSSTHASVDSDHISQNQLGTEPATGNRRPFGSPSGSSIGKDSVLSESLLLTQQDTDRGGYTAADSNGYVSDTSAISSIALGRPRLSGLEKSSEPNYSAILGDVVVVKRSLGQRDCRANRSIQFANRDSESWLKYLEGSTETLTPERCLGSETSEHSDLVTANSKNSKNKNGSKSNKPTSQGENHLSIPRSAHGHSHGHDYGLDDEAESVYSVDTDGYYTSMHTDSGLFRDKLVLSTATTTAMSAEGHITTSPSGSAMTSPGTSLHGVKSSQRRSSVSSTSTIGDMSLTSMYSKTDTENGGHYSQSTIHNKANVESGQTQNRSNLRSTERKGMPPSPPIRVSSIRSNSSLVSRPKSVELTSPSPVTGHLEGSTQTSSPRSHRSLSPYRSVPSESEQSEKLRERVKSKTCIGSMDYPSLCNVTPSSSSSASSSSSTSDTCDQISSNASSSADSFKKTGKENKKDRSKRKFFSNYKPFKIKELFSFTKKSRISPISRDSNKNGGFMSYESILVDGKEASATGNEGEDESPIHSSLGQLRRASDDRSTVKGRSPYNTPGQSSCDLYKSPSIEKNLVTLRKVDSNPYLPRPITDQSFFQSLVRSDFRSKSQEELEKNKQRSSASSSTSASSTSVESPKSDHPTATVQTDKSEQTRSTEAVRPSTLILPYKIKQRQVKVELDSNGRVLYSSNSLGRRRNDRPMACLEQPKTKENEIKKPKLKIENPQVADPLAPCALIIGRSPSPPIRPLLIPSPIGKQQMDEIKLGPISSTPKRPTKIGMSDENIPPMPIEYSVQVKKTSSLPSSEVQSTVIVGRVGPPTFPKPRFSANRHSFSGIGLAERRAQDALKVNISDSSSDLTSPASSLISPGGVRSKLSTSDLISLIHDSKRKLGLKSTDSPSSTSPMTSPRSEPLPSPPNLLSPNQRRSWSFTAKELTNNLDAIANQQPGSRRSLCSDRLGPLRPTPIQDFKRLVAAARPKAKEERISAKDLLQVSPTSTLTSVKPRTRPSTPSIALINSSLSSSSSSPSSTSSTSPASSVPRTRIINGRVYRSPYRLEVMCPPIKEDETNEEPTTTESNPNPSPRDLTSYDKRRSSLTFAGSKEIERRLLATGLCNGQSKPIKATSTWV